jgi:hypothetical protein
MCFIVHKTTSELERAILTTLFLLVQKTSRVGVPGRGICSALFHLDIPMIPPTAITIAADGERLTYGGFSLDETVHFGCFEFIANYFGGLSLCPMMGDSGATFMVSTHSGAASLR